MKKNFCAASVLVLLFAAGVVFAEDTAVKNDRPASGSERPLSPSPAQGAASSFVTRNFVLEYARPVDIIARVRKELSSEKAQAFFDPLQNTLTVIDTVDAVGKIARLVTELDKKVEIPFELRVVQIFLNEEHNNGLDWEAIVSDYQSFDIYGEKTDSPPQELRLSVGTITKEDLPVLLDALDAAGRSQEVTRANGVLTVNRSAPQGVEFWENPQDSLQKKGFALRVTATPRLTEDRVLSLSMTPELEWYPLTLEETESPRLAGFSPAERWEVKVEDDEVMIIGGLVHYVVGERVDKVPLFGDLPLLGPFFRSQNRTKQGTEYIIILVPGDFKEKSKKRIQP